MIHNTFLQRPVQLWHLVVLILVAFTVASLWGHFISSMLRPGPSQLVAKGEGFHVSRDPPRVYLFANNYDANSTWESIQIQTGDLLFMFNDAYPLKYFADIPREQIIWMLRAEDDTRYNGQKLIPELLHHFDTLIFLGGWLESNPHITELIKLPHFETLHWDSSFVADLRSSYYNPERTGPSSGYLAFKYVQRYHPFHRIITVGFTGEGVPSHNFTFERHEFEAANVTAL